MDDDLVIDLILQSLTNDFSQFIMDFTKTNMNKSISELAEMLESMERDFENNEVSKSKKVVCFHCGKFGH